MRVVGAFLQFCYTQQYDKIKLQTKTNRMRGIWREPILEMTVTKTVKTEGHLRMAGLRKYQDERNHIADESWELVFFLMHSTVNCKPILSALVRIIILMNWKSRPRLIWCFVKTGISSGISWLNQGKYMSQLIYKLPNLTAHSAILISLLNYNYYDCHFMISHSENAFTRLERCQR